MCNAWARRVARRASQSTQRQAGERLGVSQMVLIKIAPAFSCHALLSFRDTHFYLLRPLLPPVTVTCLDPSRTRSLAVKVETAVSSHAAVGGSHALKRWLRRPGKRTLLRSEPRQEQDNFIHGK